MSDKNKKRFVSAAWTVGAFIVGMVIWTWGNGAQRVNELKNQTQS